MSAAMLLLERLLSAKAPLNTQSLAVELRCDGQTLRRALDELEKAGCLLEDHPQRGLRLIESGLGCWSDFIEARHTGSLGRRLLIYQSTTSTQDVARRLVQSGLGDHEGHVIVTDCQSAGRGRMGHTWEAAEGEALLLTAITAHGPSGVDRLCVACCCAAAQAIESLMGPPVQVLWPNDLLLEGGKVAGILVEVMGEAALVGIGINVQGHPSLDSGLRPATSLAQHGVHVDRLRLLDILLENLQAALALADPSPLRAQWRARSCLMGRRVTLQSHGSRISGRVLDLDESGGLVVATDAGGVVVLPGATTTLLQVG